MNGVPAGQRARDDRRLQSRHVRGSGTGRNVELNAVSINNLSRIEAIYSPTPESPGSALAGSVNLVPRSAFERSRAGVQRQCLCCRARQHHRVGADAGAATRIHLQDSPGLSSSPRSCRSTSVRLHRLGRRLDAVRRRAVARHQRGAAPPPRPMARRSPTPRPTGRTSPTSACASSRRSPIAARSRATADYKLGRRAGCRFHFNTARSTRTSTSARSFFSSTACSRELLADVHARLRRRRRSAARTTAATTATVDLHAHPDVPARRPCLEGGGGRGHVARAEPQPQHRQGSIQRDARAPHRRHGLVRGHLLPPSARHHRHRCRTARRSIPIDINSYALSTASGERLDNRINVQNTLFANIRRDLDWRWPLTLKGGVDVRSRAAIRARPTPAVNFVGDDGRASTTPLARQR